MLAEKSWISRIPSELRGQLKYIVTFFGVGLTYLTLAKFSLVLASINPSASPIWPPTGFALASVLLLEYSVWPAIFLGSLIANATTAGSIYTSLAIASGNTVECVIGAFLINRWSDGIKTFDTPAGVAKFALICFAPSTIISATIGVGSLSLAGYSEWANSLSVWLTWWMGDLAGALVITPVIVLWTTGSARSFNRQEWFHSSFVFICAIVVGLVAFNPLLGQTANTGPLAFLAIAPLMWAALRRNQRDTATTALILACFAVWSALGGGGPLGRSTLNDSFLLLLAFVISISVPSLALSAEVAMRKSHEERIDLMMRELSHRSKNLLTVVQAIARQIARRTQNFVDFEVAFATRLGSFAEIHDLLNESEWRGADITLLVQKHLSPFRDLDEGWLTLDGPKLVLTPRAAEQIGFALHELATNAAKHGALSGESGRVSIQWKLKIEDRDQEYLHILWKESGGPVVTEVERTGFGKLVVAEIVPTSLRGKASLEFKPDGISWLLIIPTSGVLEKPPVTARRN